MLNLLDYLHQDEEQEEKKGDDSQDEPETIASASASTSLQESNIEEWAEIIRSEIKIQDF